MEVIGSYNSSSSGRFVVVGDALLDRDLDGRVDRLCPDAPVPVVDDITERTRPGGAALAAALLARDGHGVALVTAIGDDDAGCELRELIARTGVELVDLGHDGVTPEKVRVRAGSQPVARLDYGGAQSIGIGALTPRAKAVVAGARGVLVADYGRGITAHPELRRALDARDRSKPMVWDPHPRGRPPVGAASLVTPNDREARAFAGDPNADDGLGTTAARAEELRRAWGAGSVAVTRGKQGALLVSGAAHPLVVPAEPLASGDPCGAGDRFASAALSALAAGAVPSEAVIAAVAAATSFVAAGGAAGMQLVRRRDDHGPATPTPFSVAQAIRARGGTVVATSGCFDLLHAGHVSALRAARLLGDWLVVCLNSDESVRRLKGTDRPLVPERTGPRCCAGSPVSMRS